MRIHTSLLGLFLAVGCAGVPPGASPSPSQGSAGAAGTNAGAAGTSAGAAGAPVSTPAAAAATPHTGHRRCGWIGAGDTAGADTYVAHADWFDAIHPDWFAVDADGVSLRTLAGADGPALVSTAHAHGTALIPLVAAVDDPNLIRQTLADPARRSAHVKALVAVAVGHGYDGLDIDYEHLWQASDRPGFSALMTELSAAMHAAGKKLTMAMPASVDDNPNSGYDLAVLTAACDVVHIMGYDFHTMGTHEGPVAPLGWIDVVATRAASTGSPTKFVLGLANYGVTSSWFAPTREALRTCGPGYSTVDDHMASCPLGQYDSGRSPNCMTPNGHLYFEDLQSMEQKVQTAQRHGLGGITYWTLGSEPDGFFEMVRGHFN